MADTNFITAWVVMAFLAYELSVFAFDADIGGLFYAWAPVLPLVAMLIGFIPGCGPQIVVTTLYLAGAIPSRPSFPMPSRTTAMRCFRPSRWRRAPPSWPRSIPPSRR
jgi:hypothetical protein